MIDTKQLNALFYGEEEDQQQKPSLDVSGDGGLNIDKDQLNQLFESEDIETAIVDDVAVTDVPDESPEEYYLRTGQVPEGYQYVPSVPTGDLPEERVTLRRIDVPEDPTEKDLSETFDYDRTGELVSMLYGEDAPDIFYSEEYVNEKVPAALQPTVRFLGQAGDEVIKAIAVTAQAISETTQDTGEAITRAIHENVTEDSLAYDVLGMTGKEILPFSPETAGKKFGKDLGMMLEMAEAMPAVGTAAGIAGNAARKAALKPAKDIIQAEKTRERLMNKKMRIQRAQLATADEIAEREKNATIVAQQNKEVATELIQEFEDRTGKTISQTADDGTKTLDFDLARKAGVETAEQIAEDNRGTVRKYLATDVDMTDAALLAGMGDDITQPLLKPEKFDALVATVADLKKKYPNAFDKKVWEDGPKKGQEYTVIDHLFELTVNKELIAGDELIDMLNKYNINFEDYILTVVGSGSEAGKTLQKLSQIKRMRPANEMIAMQEAATKEAAGAIRKTVMRIENIRRGGLVSQVATAARNLTSGGIRAPLEGLGNVMDNALYQLTEEGYAAGAKELVSFNNWKDSFRHMKYMFGPEASLDTKDYVEFILSQPGMEKQFDLLFNNINEIQKLTGRGEGGISDEVLSVFEDAVDVLNTPNRWQEHLIRRGAFLGELERLTKREYGIDLIDTINQGKIRDLLNDASTVRPEGKRSFLNLIEDATNKALDITYAKQPEVPVFRSTSQFIVRNGLTVVLPFPRFMFNSMELMGQYAGGASIPLAKRIKSIVTKGEVEALTAKDRQRITRNLVGVAVAGAAYQYRTMDDAPSDYKLLRTSEGTAMDVTPQYPMRQFMYVGEATKRLMDGTFNDWFDVKEFSETFVGTNIRQGVGQSLIQEVADLATGVDLTAGETAGRILGRSLGNYLSTWAVPFAQIIEAERGLGMRGLEYKDTAFDPTLDFQSSFMENLQRPFTRFESPAAEAARPEREFLFAEEKRRVAPMARVLGGFNIATMDDDYGEYIASFGFTDYGLGSKSKVGSIRRYENEAIRNYLPMIAESAKELESDARAKYSKSNDALKERITEEAYVSSRVRNFIEKQIKSVKREISDGKTLAADAPEYVEAMLTYRRMGPSTRKDATVRFIEKYGRDPDGASATDLNRLVIIGKAIEQAYK
jgi:hypothetical protein